MRTYRVPNMLLICKNTRYVSNGSPICRTECKYITHISDTRHVPDNIDFNQCLDFGDNGKEFIIYLFFFCFFSLITLLPFLDFVLGCFGLRRHSVRIFFILFILFFCFFLLIMLLFFLDFVLGCLDFGDDW